MFDKNSNSVQSAQSSDGINTMHECNNVSQTSQDIERREAIKRLSALMGGAVSLSTITLALSSCEQQKQEKSQTSDIDSANSKESAPLWLSKQQLDTLEKSVDIIIPPTDTPGAAAVDTHHFIHRFVPACGSQWEQDAIEKTLSNFDKSAKIHHGQSFIECDEDQQIAIMTALDTATQGASESDKQAFAVLKSLTILGYYTSEIGATQELKYLAIPGGYKGVPFSDVGKTWSSPI